MNASYSSETSTPTPSGAERPPVARQTPSVPISVYRELATELKATQALVDSLTQQNQQLGQQNQQLRQEMIKFAESAAQLKQTLEASPLFSLELVRPAPPAEPVEATPVVPALAPQVLVSQALAPQPSVDIPPSPAGEPAAHGFSLEGVSALTSQFSQMLKPKAKASKKAPKPLPKSPQKRPQPIPPAPPMLYTEERLDLTRPGQLKEKKSDLSGLWLATAIVLIVVSAFGAGFLIMKPLLKNAR
ncbi:MAG TPA: hypothetical protein IGR64_06755 [Leptolyngbyaceae cyanobacterium M65_K2018_010]|nr:hypothetical protein [Leptolyngbyaceae cyanobacterium M65_K2018_010]